jgi:hypothetical protein
MNNETDRMIEFLRTLDETEKAQALDEYKLFFLTVLGGYPDPEIDGLWYLEHIAAAAYLRFQDICDAATAVEEEPLVENVT